ncbi:MAG: signal peptidase II [Bacteroidales bacterium]|nr:signal peptidase II [Bacteroidales bacterium]
MKKRSLFVCLLILLLIVADQVLKVWVKTHLSLGEQVAVFGKWFSLHYIENEGIAFGMVFWTRPIGKVLLTLFRLFASGFILWAIHKMLTFREKLPFGFLLCSVLVFAGAVGNVVDCVFYGRVFSYSDYYGPVATLFPEAGGYAPFFQGKVVDMLQFDLFDIPLGANRIFHFFPAIFNLADAYITTGLLVMLVFYNKALSVFASAFDSKKKEESC